MENDLQTLDKAICFLKGSYDSLATARLGKFLFRSNVAREKDMDNVRIRIKQAKCLLDLLDDTVDSESLSQSQFEYIDDIGEEYQCELLMPPSKDGRLRPFFDVTSLNDEDVTSMVIRIDSVGLVIERVDTENNKKLMEVFNG